MSVGRSSCVRVLLLSGVLGALCPVEADAADVYVAAGGDLQAAIDGAVGGDTIFLQAGATFVGNFRLKVHPGTGVVTIRSSAPDAQLPAPGTRISPAHAPLLPKLRSATSEPVFFTAPGAANWRLQTLELQSTHQGLYDIVALGDGSSAQSTLDRVPQNLTIDRVYVHADPQHGQKRAIALNSGHTVIRDSYIEGIRALNQDSQAIGGWNGPGPYTLENNYLEAAGEVFMLGGADPSIPNMVPADVEVRGNTFTRPLSWRAPVLDSPANVVATGLSGGALLPGTYAYRVVALMPAGSEVAASVPSADQIVTLSSFGRVNVSWNAVRMAAAYQIVRTSADGQSSWVTTGVAWTDDGTAPGTAGAVPPVGRWNVKNLLEVKNGRRIRIEGNLFENNWADAQDGGAIVLTPRNQDGTCTWCIVEDVTFERNVMRRVGMGVVILGWDELHPSRQLNNVRIRNNVISDVGPEWGGAGYFLLVLGQPRDVVVDHNTFISKNGQAVIAVDGPPISNFVFTNNITLHNVYGIVGKARAPGNDTIATFFDGAIITRNVFGAPPYPYDYPAGNELPTESDFEAHFVDYAGGNYALRPATDWANAGTDGLDLGAIMTLPVVTAPRNPRLVR